MAAASGEFQSVCPASVDRLPTSPSVQPPSRAQTVTNNLALVNGSPAGVKDTNVRGAGSMEGVETVRVTDMTSSSAFTKSIGSLFSTINKSVSSAFNSLMAAPAGGTGEAQPAAAVAAAPVPGPPHAEVDSVALQPRLGHEPPHHHPAWHRAQPQPYTEPAGYRGDHFISAYPLWHNTSTPVPADAVVAMAQSPWGDDPTGVRSFVHYFGQRSSLLWSLDPSAETFMSVQCVSPGRGWELVGVCGVCARRVG